MTSLAMLQCINTTDVFHYANAKIPEISVGSSDQNIWDHLWKWSSYFGEPNFSDSSIFDNRFIIAVLLLTYLANSEKEYKLVRATDYSWLIAWFHVMWSTVHVINTILGNYAHFWIFWQEFFMARKKRLAARSSRLGLAGSQNSLPQVSAFYEQTSHKQNPQNERNNACIYS